MKTCDWCGSEYTPVKPHAKTCSPDCREARRKHRARQYALANYQPAQPKAPIPCAHCGEAFTPYRASSKFCTRRCQWNYKTIESRPRTRPCVRCGVATPTRPGKPVCADCRLDKRDPVKAKAREQRRRLGAYGITQDHYDRMLTEQCGECRICRTRDPGPKDWAIDHCHTTGRVRGLLCATCNLGLGHFGDDPKILDAAAEYLRAS